VSSAQKYLGYKNLYFNNFTHKISHTYYKSIRSETKLGFFMVPLSHLPGPSNNFFAKEKTCLLYLIRSQPNSDLTYYLRVGVPARAICSFYVFVLIHCLCGTTLVSYSPQARFSRVYMAFK